MLFRRLLPALHLLQDLDPNESVAFSLLTGLVCSYQFENASDLGHDDYSFINLSITGSTGSVTQVTGKDDYGVTCAGKYLQGDGATDVDPGNGITLCGWFKCDNNTGAGYNRVLVCLKEAATGHTSANPDPSVFLTSTGGTHIPNLQFYDSGNTLRTLSLSAIADPTVWHFFVARFEDGNQSLQVDNDTPATSTYAIDDTIAFPQSLKRVLIGVADSAGETVTADGILIYNRILTGYESDVLFNMTAGRFYPFGQQADAEASQSTAEVGGYAIAAPAAEASLSTAAVGGYAFVPGISEASLSTAAVTAAFVAAVPESSASTAEVPGAATVPAYSEASLSTAAVGGYVFAPGIAEASLSTAEAEETYGAEPAVAEASLSTAEVGGAAGTPPRGEAGLMTADAGGYVTIPAYSEASLSTAAAETVHPVTDPAIAEASLSTAAVVAAAGTPPRGEASLSTASAQYVRGDDMLTVNVKTVLVNGVKANGNPVINEQDTARVVFDLVDESSEPINIELIKSLLITVTTGAGDQRTVIRPTEEGLAAQFVSLATVGGRSLLTWDVQSYESRVINSTLGLNNDEPHNITLELCWYPAEELSLSDPFTTAADSADVTVTHPAHGLKVARDSVVIQGSTDVAGVDCDGIYTITEVVDGDRYKIRHKSQSATATATGGGAVRMLVSPRRKTLVQTLKVKRSDLT